MSIDTDTQLQNITGARSDPTTIPSSPDLGRGYPFNLTLTRLFSFCSDYTTATRLSPRNDSGALSGRNRSDANRRSDSGALSGTSDSRARSRSSGSGARAFQNRGGGGGGRRSESVRWVDGTGCSGDGRSSRPSFVYSGGGCLPPSGRRRNDLRLGNGRQTWFFLAAIGRVTPCSFGVL